MTNDGNSYSEDEKAKIERYLKQLETQTGPGPGGIPVKSYKIFKGDTEQKS
jgi:hypothetical protein